jgi:hypothetical protein
MAVVRAPATIVDGSPIPALMDTFVANYMYPYPNQLLHDWGSGTSFGSELEPSAETIEYGGVSVETIPTVVSRTTSNVDMFYVDGNGGLYTVFQSAPTYTWYTETLIPPSFTEHVGYATITIPSIAPSNALVTATARSPENLDVFFIGTDGNVYTTYWGAGFGTNASGLPNWGTPFSITSGACINTATSCVGVASPGGGIAAVSRNPNQLDVFYIGKDGGLWTSWWYNGAPSWTTMELYGPSSDVQRSAGIAPPGATITATARTSTNLDVFFVGSDGGLWTGAWSGGGGWGTWEIPGSAGTGEAGGPISAVSRQAASLDVVYQGPGSSLEWGAWASPAAWRIAPIPAAVGISTSMIGRGAVSIVAPTSFSLQAFYINTSHQENTVSWSDPTQCDTLSSIACSSSSADFPWTGEITLPEY